MPLDCPCQEPGLNLNFGAQHEKERGLHTFFPKEFGAQSGVDPLNLNLSTLEGGATFAQRITFLPGKNVGGGLPPKRIFFKKTPF